MAATHTRSATAGGQASPITISSFDASGTDRFLKLIVASRGTATVTGATFNTSENFTEQTTLEANGARLTYLTLLNPTSTTANVVISFSGSPRSVCGVSLYEGVNQTTAIRAGTLQSASGTSTTPAVSVTATSGDLIVDGMAVVAEGPPSITADHTQRINATQTGGGEDVGLGGQELAATGSSQSMSWVLGSSSDWVSIALALVPEASALSIPIAAYHYNHRLKV